MLKVLALAVCFVCVTALPLADNSVEDVEPSHDVLLSLAQKVQEGYHGEVASAYKYQLRGWFSLPHGGIKVSFS